MKKIGLGINKFKKNISKDGIFNIKYTDEIAKDAILIDGYTNYYPSFCIKKNGKVEIRWNSYENYSNSNKNLALQTVINSNEYETIFSGQHCSNKMWINLKKDLI